MGSNRLIVEGSTRHLPPGDDYEYFLEAVASLYIGVRPDRPHSAFAADFALFDLGTTGLGMLQTPPNAAERTARDIRQTPDDAYFLNFSRAPWRVDHGGRLWNVPAGMPFLLDNARPYRLAFQRNMRLYSLRIPRELLGPDAATRVNSRMPNTGAGGHVITQTALLAHMADARQLDLASTMGVAVIGLLDSVTRSEETSGQERLTTMKLASLQELTDPAFGLASIARRMRCSPRTVQAAFAAAGETFSSWLTGQRLELARDRLRSPQWHAHTVASIGASVGFSDSSSFHKAFKARYGQTPGSAR